MVNDDSRIIEDTLNNNDTDNNKNNYKNNINNVLQEKTNSIINYSKIDNNNILINQNNIITNNKNIEIENAYNKIENTKDVNEIVDGEEINMKGNSNFNVNINNVSENKENYGNNFSNENSIEKVINNNNNKNKCKLNIEIINPKHISNIKILDSNDIKSNDKDEEPSCRKRLGTFDDTINLKKQKFEENNSVSESNNTFSILFNSSLRDPNNPISYTITGPDFKKDGLELIIEDHRNSSIIENMQHRIPVYEKFDTEIQDIIENICKELDQSVHNILNDIDISVLKKGKNYEENNIIKNFLTSKLNVLENTINYYHQLKHSLENDLFSIQAMRERLMKDYVSRFGKVEEDSQFNDVLKKNVICKININRNEEDDSDNFEKQSEPKITYHSEDTTTERKTNNENQFNNYKYKGKERECKSLEETSSDNFKTESNSNQNNKSLKITIDVENLVDDSETFQKYIQDNLNNIIKNYQTCINNVNLRKESYHNRNKMTLDELPLFSSSISLKLTDDFFKNLFPKFEDILPRFQDIIPKFDDIFSRHYSVHSSPPFLQPTHHRRKIDDHLSKPSTSTIINDASIEKKGASATTSIKLSKIKNEGDSKVLNNTSLTLQNPHSFNEKNYLYKTSNNSSLAIKKEKEGVTNKDSVIFKKEIGHGVNSTSQSMNLRTEFTNTASSSRSIHFDSQEHIIRPPNNNNFEIPINPVFAYNNATMEQDEEESKSSYKKAKNKKNKKKKKKGKNKEEDGDLIVID